MGKHLDLDDVAEGHPLAVADLRELRANQCAQFTGGESCPTVRALRERAKKAEAEVERFRAALMSLRQAFEWRLACTDFAKMTEAEEEAMEAARLMIVGGEGR